MSDTFLILLSAVIAIVAGILIWVWLRRNRTQQLRAKFGPEYERTVHETGSPARAEQELQARARKVAAFRIRTLSRDEQERYTTAWRRLQALFVDQPKEAVLEADHLIADVMRTRGYPVSDLDARTEQLSVDHARTVEDYRTAHELVTRHERGEAGTEDLRQAMTHYRALFEDLVGAAEVGEVRRRA